MCILVGDTPGGVPDIAVRVLSQKLTEPWKQPIIVENRLGAGSNVAAQAVARNKPGIFNYAAAGVDEYPGQTARVRGPPTLAISSRSIFSTTG